MDKEKQCLQIFRKEMINRSNVVDKMLSSISHISGLHNIVIMHNNKISELIHYFYRNDVKFFCDSFISSSLTNYLNYYLLLGMESINNYYKETFTHIYQPINNKNYEYINKYKDYSNIIYNFDIDKDLIKAIDFYLSSLLVEKNIQIDYLENFNDFKESLLLELKKLELDNYINEINILLNDKRNNLLNNKNKTV